VIFTKYRNFAHYTSLGLLGTWTALYKSLTISVFPLGIYTHFRLENDYWEDTEIEPTNRVLYSVHLHVGETLLQYYNNISTIMCSLASYPPDMRHS